MIHLSKGDKVQYIRGSDIGISKDKEYNISDVKLSENNTLTVELSEISGYFSASNFELITPKLGEEADIFIRVLLGFKDSPRYPEMIKSKDHVTTARDLYISGKASRADFLQIVNNAYEILLLLYKLSKPMALPPITENIGLRVESNLRPMEKYIDSQKEAPQKELPLTTDHFGGDSGDYFFQDLIPYGKTQEDEISDISDEDQDLIARAMDTTAKIKYRGQGNRIMEITDESGIRNENFIRDKEAYNRFNNKHYCVGKEEVMIMDNEVKELNKKAAESIVKTESKTPKVDVSIPLVEEIPSIHAPKSEGDSSQVQPTIPWDIRKASNVEIFKRVFNNTLTEEENQIIDGFLEDRFAMEDEAARNAKFYNRFVRGLLSLIGFGPNQGQNKE